MLCVPTTIGEVIQCAKLFFHNEHNKGRLRVCLLLQSTSKMAIREEDCHFQLASMRNQVPSLMIRFNWHQKFQDGNKSLAEAPHTGCPLRQKIWIVNSTCGAQRSPFLRDFTVFAHAKGSSYSTIFAFQVRFQDSLSPPPRLQHTGLGTLCIVLHSRSWPSLPVCLDCSIVVMDDNRSIHVYGMHSRQFVNSEGQNNSQPKQGKGVHGLPRSIQCSALLIGDFNQPYDKKDLCCGQLDRILRSCNPSLL